MTKFRNDSFWFTIYFNLWDLGDVANNLGTRYVMRILIALSILCLSITSCKGSDSGGSSAAAAPCANSALLGTYTYSSDTMVISSDCKITSTACASTTSFSGATATEGYISATVSSTNGASGCLPLGTYNCAYQLSGNTLAYNCGGGAIAYTKQ